MKISHYVYIIILIGFFCGKEILIADDWPVYMHDSSRTGISDAKLNFPMKLAWKYSPNYPPAPSWPKPAKQDFWHYIPKLAPTTIFDRVFHTITFDNKVAFSSSADNCIYCLDEKSGNILWKFITNGPVRLAPYYLNKKIYCASDDGYLYCLNPDTGKELWKYWAGGKEKRYLPGNSRVISRWPIRAGIVSDGKFLYFAAGLFPKEKVFLCAIDLATGKEKYKKIIPVSAQGYMSLHNGRLYIPVGRTAQVAFNAESGKKVFNLFPGDSSSIYNKLIFSGRNERGETAIYSSSTKKIIARLKARQIIVDGNNIFLLQSNTISVVDKKAFLDSSKKIVDIEAIYKNKRTKEQKAELKAAEIARSKAYKWSTRINGAINMILTSNAIVAGCSNKIVSISKVTGKELWQHQTDGSIYGLNAVNNRLIASSDSGSIYCFVFGKRKISKKKIAKKALSNKQQFKRKYHDTLMNAWFFTEDNIKNGEIIDLAGKRNIIFPESAKFANSGKFKSFQSNGKLNLSIGDQKDIGLLPKEAFSVEVSISISKTTKWGGIIGAFQDNGNYEKGWILGYQGNRFLFGLATEGGKNVITYLKSKKTFKLNNWYHVVGVYDGKKMTIYVNGQESGSSTAQSGKISYSPDFFYDIAAYHDKDENNKMSGQILEICVYNSALKNGDILAGMNAIKPWFPDTTEVVLNVTEAEPVVTFSPGGKCNISFSNAIKKNTKLAYGRNKEKLKKNIPMQNSFTFLTNLKSGTKYYYSLLDKNDKCGVIYSFTTPFNPFKSKAAFKNNKKFAKAAEAILKKSNFKKGYCYIYDFGKGELAYEIAKRSDLHIIGIEKDVATIAKARAKFAKLGLYGTRINIFNTSDKNKFQPKTGNIITSGNSFISGKLPDESIDNLYQMTRPNGGVILFLMPLNSNIKLSKPNKASEKWKTSKNSSFKIYALERDKLKNSGEWSHIYAEPGGTACSDEKLTSRDLEMQWFGPPGPERMADRHHRQMPPLFTNGNLFILGDNYLYGVDGYNGALLWEYIIPKSRRLGIMYDTGIMAADSKHLFIGSGDKCLAIGSRSGELVKEFKVPYKNQDWGYLSIINNNLIGSGQPVNASWNKLGRVNILMEGDFKLFACSRNLFSYNSASGKLNWKYNKGIIINPTIVQGNGKIFFIEIRDRELVKKTDGRFVLKDLLEKGKASVVALDIKTGKEVWHSSFLPKFRNIIFLNYSDGILLASGSYNVDKFVQYTMIAYNAMSGKQLWESESSLKGAKRGGSHGEQWQHPAIVNGKIFLQSHVTDLKTGKKIETLKGWARAGGGCGTISASADSLFFRYASPVQKNINTGKNNRLTMVSRPGCWINIIPAGGMVLIPEASSGCTCSYAIQSSMALAPKE